MLKCLHVVAPSRLINQNVTSFNNPAECRAVSSASQRVVYHSISVVFSATSFPTTNTTRRSPLPQNPTTNQRRTTRRRRKRTIPKTVIRTKTEPRNSLSSRTFRSTSDTLIRSPTLPLGPSASANRPSSPPLGRAGSTGNGPVFPLRFRVNRTGRGSRRSGTGFSENRLVRWRWQSSSNATGTVTVPGKSI